MCSGMFRRGGSTNFFKEGVVSIRVHGKPWTNPFEQISANFASFQNRSFYSLKGFVFYLEYYRILFLGLFCIKKKRKNINKSQLFDQTHGTFFIFCYYEK